MATFRDNKQAICSILSMIFQLPIHRKTAALSQKKTITESVLLVLMLLYPSWHDNYATLFRYSLPLLASYDWSTAIAVMYLNGYGAISKKFTPGWRNFKCLQIR